MRRPRAYSTLERALLLSTIAFDSFELGNHYVLKSLRFHQLIGQAQQTYQIEQHVVDLECMNSVQKTIGMLSIPSNNGNSRSG
jgi:hypothetical protein